MVSNADRWEELAKEIAAAEADRLEHIRRDRQARQEREQLWHWSQTHAGDVMSEVAAAAVRRAEELAIRTGVRLSVRGPEHCVMTKPTSAQVWVVRVAHGPRQLVVYAYASPGGLPLVHYLVDGDVGFVKSTKRHRLVSFPGCRIAPSSERQPHAAPAGARRHYRARRGSRARRHRVPRLRAAAPARRHASGRTCLAARAENGGGTAALAPPDAVRGRVNASGSAWNLPLPMRGFWGNLRCSECRPKPSSISCCEISET